MSRAVGGWLAGRVSDAVGRMFRGCRFAGRVSRAFPFGGVDGGSRWFMRGVSVERCAMCVVLSGARRGYGDAGVRRLGEVGG